MNKKINRKNIDYYIYLIFIVLCFYNALNQIDTNIKGCITCILCSLNIIILIMVEKIFKIKISIPLKIIYLIFVYSSLILGEVYSFYIKCNLLDIILHFSLGFFWSIISFFLIDVINGNKFHTKIKFLFIAIFTTCFSIGIGVMWEFYEYSCDKIRIKDYQKNNIVNNIVISKLNNGITEYDNIKIESLIVNGEDWIKKYGGYIDIGLNDTIKDLFVCFVGCVISNIFMYFYLKNKKNFIKYLFIKKLS